MSVIHIALRLALACTMLHMVACRHKVILVSCDGFRYDYLDWYPEETKFLRQLIPMGTHVQRMTPAFATKTFPNHWTIATGLYQESHGILSNSMYDPEFNETFNKGTRDERWWNASLPIWLHAKKHGLNTATFFWPGSEVQIRGLRQNQFYDYKDSGKYSFEFRGQKVLDWVTKEEMELAVMYLDQPDRSGHTFGPRSDEVREALREVDNTIRQLFVGLEESGFSDKVNVLIVSDHGMASITKEKLINLTNTLDTYVERFLDSGPLLGVNPKPGETQKLITFLENEIGKKNLSMRVFSKKTLPTKYHYANHRRTPEVLVLPHQGYYVVTSRDRAPSKGNHGFDNEYSDMKVPMFAVGPSFRRNALVEGFRQIDIYGLVCHLLEIESGPNNGSLELLPLMLKVASRFSSAWIGVTVSALLSGVLKYAAMS